MSMSDYQSLTGEEKVKVLKRIGVARGIVVMRAKPLRPVKPLMVRIFDSTAKRYDNTAFDDMDALVLHARTTWMNFQTGESAAGRVLLETIRPRFMASARQTCDGGQLETYGRIFDRLKAAKITDLKSPSLQADCIRMLEKLAAGSESRTEDGKRIKRQRPWKPGTWNAAVQSMQAIGSWCTKKANRVLLKDNPFDDFPKRAEPRAMPAIYTVAEMRLLAQPKTMETEIGRLLVILMLSGMRLNEARWLRWSSFDWHVGVVNVTLSDGIDLAKQRALGIELDLAKRDGRRKSIKTDEERAIPLERDLIALLKPWAGVGDGYVFSDLFLTMASEQYMWRIRNMVFKDLKIRLRPRIIHVFRHTYACVLEGAGLPRAALKRRLGHSEKCNTTENYLQAAHVIAKDVQDWKREFRLLDGCNAGANSPGKHGLSGVGAAGGSKAIKFDVSHGFGLDYGANTSAIPSSHGRSSEARYMVPIQLTGVRFTSPAFHLNSDFVVVLEDDQKLG